MVVRMRCMACRRRELIQHRAKKAELGKVYTCLVCGLVSTPDWRILDLARAVFVKAWVSGEAIPDNGPDRMDHALRHWDQQITILRHAAGDATADAVLFISKWLGSATAMAPATWNIEQLPWEDP